MTGPDPGSKLHELTLIVRDLARGRERDGASILPYLLGEMRAIATGHLRFQRPGHTLQATALVHEAYLKLFGGDGLDVHDRLHFFALAAKAMRQVLVDHARRRQSLKRGGEREQVSITIPARPDGVDVDVLDLHQALQELSAKDERQGRLVELRYFGGLEVAEVAEVLGLSKTTVEREWRMARAWLGSRMKREREP